MSTLGCQRGVLKDKARESKRAKGHWQNARKIKYESVPDRYMNDVLYRETMHELGFNLTGMRRWEHNGNPENRVDAFAPLPKAIREERGVGQYRRAVT